MRQTTPAVPVAFSTAGLPEGQRVELWESHNAAALIGLRCRTLTAAVLEATEINVQLERIHLARVHGERQVAYGGEFVVHLAETGDFDHARFRWEDLGPRLGSEAGVRGDADTSAPPPPRHPT